MDFREATDILCTKVDHSDLARALGVSTQSVRQARLKPEAGAHRSPPEAWRSAVIRLAEEKVGRYQALIKQIRQTE